MVILFHFAQAHLWQRVFKTIYVCIFKSVIIDLYSGYLKGRVENSFLDCICSLPQLTPYTHIHKEHTYPLRSNIIIYLLWLILLTEEVSSVDFHGKHCLCKQPPATGWGMSCAEIQCVQLISWWSTLSEWGIHGDRASYMCRARKLLCWAP